MANGRKLANSIRDGRLGVGLSQQKLAALLGVTQGTISNWESGKGGPDQSQQRVLDRVLGADSAQDEWGEGQTPLAAWLGRALVEKGFTVPELAEETELSVATIYNLLSGRASNPQKRTLARIEKALGQTFEGIGPDEPAGDVPIGELIDFDPHDGEFLPDEPGVYVFYDITNRAVYVGQGGSVAKRVRDHDQNYWFKKPIVQNAAYVKVQDSRLRNQLETVLIQFLKSNALLNQKKTKRA